MILNQRTLTLRHVVNCTKFGTIGQMSDPIHRQDISRSVCDQGLPKQVKTSKTIAPKFLQFTTILLILGTMNNIFININITYQVLLLTKTPCHTYCKLFSAAMFHQ